MTLGSELRRWFGHVPERWADLRARYIEELDRIPQSWEGIFVDLKKGNVTLLFAASDTARNNTLALRDELAAKLRFGGGSELHLDSAVWHLTKGTATLFNNWTDGPSTRDPAARES